MGHPQGSRAAQWHETLFAGQLGHRRPSSPTTASNRQEHNPRGMDPDCKPVHHLLFQSRYGLRLFRRASEFYSFFEIPRHRRPCSPPTGSNHPTRSPLDMEEDPRMKWTRSHFHSNPLPHSGLRSSLSCEPVVQCRTMKSKCPTGPSLTTRSLQDKPCCCNSCFHSYLHRMVSHHSQLALSLPCPSVLNRHHMMRCIRPTGPSRPIHSEVGKKQGYNHVTADSHLRNLSHHAAWGSESDACDNCFQYHMRQSMHASPANLTTGSPQGRYLWSNTFPHMFRWCTLHHRIELHWQYHADAQQRLAHRRCCNQTIGTSRTSRN
mmetsp:Transcript_6922/g.16445  ORF Transcript_6922/g.16445 Transcript_6922/m.16445 type:complete len:320 (+) Transcript_6922:1678-2637(+)